MTVALVQLLARARPAGLTLDRGPDGRLVVRGPKTSEALAQALLARKLEVLTVVDVWNGRAQRLDWRRARILDDFRSCVLCGRRTLLLDPWDERPCHKSCVEAAIRWGTVSAAHQDGGLVA